jgi:hypothetical protein
MTATPNTQRAATMTRNISTPGQSTAAATKAACNPECEDQYTDSSVATYTARLKAGKAAERTTEEATTAITQPTKQASTNSSVGSILPSQNNTPDEAWATQEHEACIWEWIAANPDHFEGSIQTPIPEVETLCLEDEFEAAVQASDATITWLHPQLAVFVDSIPDELWRQPASITMDHLNDVDAELLELFRVQEDIQTCLV